MDSGLVFIGSSDDFSNSDSPVEKPDSAVSPTENPDSAVEKSDSAVSPTGNPDSAVEKPDSAVSPTENPDSAAEKPDSGGSSSGTSARQVKEFTDKYGPSRQVKEFTDKYGVYRAYLCTMEFEVNPNYNEEHFGDSEDEEDGDVNNVADPRQALIDHTRQVRESFGFDVDVVVPSWANVSYYPVDLSDPTRLEEMREAALAGIDQINADMNEKCFELVEILKAVLTPNWMHHLTLSVKKLDDNSLVTIQAIVTDTHPDGGMELEQWRFKPLS